MGHNSQVAVSGMLVNFSLRNINHLCYMNLVYGIIKKRSDVT